MISTLQTIFLIHLAIGVLTIAQGLLMAWCAIGELRARDARRALVAPLPRWAGHAVGVDPTVIPATVQRKER